MARGHQKIQSQQKNLQKKNADAKKNSQHASKSAAAKLTFQCAVCKTVMPDPKTYRNHFENKHPKNDIPQELKDLDEAASTS